MILFLASLIGLASAYRDLVVVPLPVTFYLGDLGEVTADSNDYVYYHVYVCAEAIVNSTQVELTMSLPNNVVWDTATAGYLMVQVSVCEGKFTKDCVLAQNYAWGAHVKAVPKIIWDFDASKVDYYIRALAGNLPTQFSMEMQFLSNANPRFYDWTTNYPFDGELVTKAPRHLHQYWKARENYYVKNLKVVYFALAYCDEGNVVTGISVALTAPPSEPDSLVTAYACPQSISVNDCTQSSAKQYGWVNTFVSSFNLLTCEDGTQRSTQHGIYIGVEGYGGDTSLLNNFTLQATTQE